LDPSEWDETGGEASYFAPSVHCPNLLPRSFLSFLFSFPLDIPAPKHGRERCVKGARRCLERLLLASKEAGFDFSERALRGEPKKTLV
jgi:hypothetical protein